MAMKIITGYTGGSHITPADDAGLYRSIFGTDDYVLHAGSQFAAKTETNTEIKIADGELIMQGRHARIDSGYESVTISNGTQGMYRNDLIVARYTKDADSSVETIGLVVIKGTATSGTATDPDYNKGDIELGTTRDFPLYRVKLNGINIDKVEQLWESPVLSVERGGTGKTDVTGIKSLLGLAKAAFVDMVTVALGGTGKASHTSNAVLTGNGTNAVNNVATANGALYATAANGAAKFGTLPIAQGGTGATTATNALKSLGADNSYLKKYEIDSIDIDNTGGNWTVDIRTSGHGTIPDVWVNVTQRTSGHFLVQIAQQCQNSNDVPDESRVPKMWIRDKYASSGRTWSTWRRVVTEDNAVQMKKLWENTNLNSAFDGQAISFSTNYDIFIVAFSETEANTTSFAERTATIRVGTANYAHLHGETYFRQVSVDGNKLNFTVAINGSGTVNNKQVVPTAIYGIKCVK